MKKRKNMKNRKGFFKKYWWIGLIMIAVISVLGTLQTFMIFDAYTCPVNYKCEVTPILECTKNLNNGEDTVVARTNIDLGSIDCGTNNFHCKPSRIPYYFWDNKNNLFIVATKGVLGISSYNSQEFEELEVVSTISSSNPSIYGSVLFSFEQETKDGIMHKLKIMKNLPGGDGEYLLFIDGSGYGAILDFVTNSEVPTTPNSIEPYASKGQEAYSIGEIYQCSKNIYINGKLEDVISWNSNKPTTNYKPNTYFLDGNDFSNNKINYNGEIEVFEFESIEDAPKPENPSPSSWSIWATLGSFLNWLRNIFDNIFVQQSILGPVEVQPGETYTYSIDLSTTSPDNYYQDGYYEVHYGGWALFDDNENILEEGERPEVFGSYNKDVTLTVPTAEGENFVLVGIITEINGTYNSQTGEWDYDDEYIKIKEAIDIKTLYEIKEPTKPVPSKLTQFLNSIVNWFKDIFSGIFG